jgi:hypothetical protein
MSKGADGRRPSWLTLHPEADAALRDRLDTLYSSTQPAPAPRVIRLPERPRAWPQRGPRRLRQRQERRRW